MSMNEDLVSKIKKNLKKGKILAEYDVDELDYIRKPIGRSIYKESINKTKTKTIRKWNGKERIKCDVCGKVFRRSNRNVHVKSKLHQAYLNINNKFKKLLLK